MAVTGSRGAKGSIRDRLVSMMYRNRYKKFKLKKESYTVDRKEKEKQFIIDLEVYQKKGTKEVLSRPERAMVSNGFIQKFEIQEKEKTIIKKDTDERIDTITKKIKFVGEPQFVHYKKLAEEEKINFKKEKKQVESEITILKEIDKFITSTKSELDEISKQIDSLKKQNINSITIEDSEQLKNRYSIVSKKILDIKNKYKILSEKYDFEDYYLLDNLKLIEAATTYKSLATIEELEVMVEVVKDKVNDLKKIKLVEENSLSTKKSIDDNSDIIKKREDSYASSLEKFSKVKDLDSFLKEEMSNVQEIIEDLNKRVDKFEKIIVVDKVVTGYDKLFASFLKIAAGIFTIPFNDKKIGKTVLGMGLINRGLQSLENSLQIEKKTSIKYIYEDLEKNIKNSKDKILDLDNLLLDSSVRIKNIKSQFLDNFINYTNIPKYEELRYKVDLLERTINEKQRQIRVMQGKLDNQLERNKVKVQKIKKR